MKKNLIILTAMAALLCGCSDNNGECPEPTPKPNIIELTADEARLLSGIEQFSYELFAKTNELDVENNNIVMSPWSVANMLSALNNANDEETRQQIFNILNIQQINENAQAELNELNKRLYSDLANLTEKVTIKSFCSVWTKQDYNLYHDFKSILSSYYFAENGKFIDSEDLQARLDEWLYRKSQGTISTFVADIDDEVDILISEQVNFKGEWTTKFGQATTGRSVFNNADGTQSIVKMMINPMSIRFAMNHKIAAVSRDLGDGEYSMMLILPKDDYNINEATSDLKSMISSLSFNQEQILLSLPVIDIYDKCSLTNVLINMGLPANQKVDMLQGSRTVINENGTNGTETTVTSRATDFYPQEITFDRPFVYILKENSTGIILQMGKIVRL